MDDLPQVLILGHSFVRRFQHYLKSTEDRRVAEDMNLSRICYVQTYGIGGRTVRKLRMFDLDVVQRISPDVVILEIGTNDLAKSSPRLVAEDIKTLCHDLYCLYGVRKIVISQIIFRANNSIFNAAVSECNSILQTFFEHNDHITFWRHRGLNNPAVQIHRRDRVHLNDAGNFALYKSYRGAIIHALKKWRNKDHVDICVIFHSSNNSFITLQPSHAAILNRSLFLAHGESSSLRNPWTIDSNKCNCKAV